MKKFKKIGIILLFISVPGMFAFKAADNYFEISKNMEIMAAVVREVNTYYVDEVDASKLVRTGIDAMLNSLDPYTNYYSESEIEDYRFMTTGQYGGIGSTISMREEHIMIVEPYENWPAQKADLRGGDVLLEVDGASTKNKNTDEVSKMLKGTPGTQVKLLVKRQGVDKPFEKTITRQEITIGNVPYYGLINDQTGYIKFSGFRPDAAKEVREAMEKLKAENHITQLVLDLRGNPGGLLDEAIKAVNVFIDKGQLVVSTRGKMEDWRKEYRTDDAAADTKIPLVVLTDGGSASAAEIVSGSLQDLDRAIIVGNSTFGKGLVQTTRSLPYGTQMKITVSKYYIPSGRCIQAIDYAHKDDKGKGTRLADSLKHEFKTKAGRTVYDGTGIKPDVTVEKASYPDVIVSLGQKRLFFDYATLYRSKHESIASAKSFHLTEADFKDFMTFLKDKSYEYVTETEESVQKLEAAAKDEKYYDAIKKEIAEMTEKLKADKQEDVKKYKAEIIQLLEEEIASRYYYQAGRIQASFDDDKDIKEALEIFANPTRYKQLLTASK